MKKREFYAPVLPWWYNLKEGVYTKKELLNERRKLKPKKKTQWK